MIIIESRRSIAGSRTPGVNPVSSSPSSASRSKCNGPGQQTHAHTHKRCRRSYGKPIHTNDDADHKALGYPQETMAKIMKTNDDDDRMVSRYTGMSHVDDPRA
jgi:hypothetical protein